MSDDRTVLDLTVNELSDLFEAKAHQVATSFATTKIQEAVRAGCLECFKEFGFNVDHPEESMKNQLYLTRTRISSEKVATAFKISLIGAVATVLVTAIVKLLKVVCP